MDTFDFLVLPYSAHFKIIKRRWSIDSSAVLEIIDDVCENMEDDHSVTAHCSLLTVITAGVGLYSYRNFCFATFVSQISTVRSMQPVDSLRTTTQLQNLANIGDCNSYDLVRPHSAEFSDCQRIQDTSSLRDAAQWRWNLSVYQHHGAYCSSRLTEPYSRSNSGRSCVVCKEREGRSLRWCWRRVVLQAKGGLQAVTEEIGEGSQWSTESSCRFRGGLWWRRHTKLLYLIILYILDSMLLHYTALSIQVYSDCFLPHTARLFLENCDTRREADHYWNRIIDDLNS